MATDFRVPKIRVTVELAVLGGEGRRVDLFVSEHRRNSPVRQSIIDLLEENDEFVPAVDDAGTSLFNKSSLSFVAIPLRSGQLPVEEENFEPEEALYDRRVRVEVELVGGRMLAGELLYSPPPGRTRVIDHLNGLTRFFRLWTAERVYLVNKNHVLRVTEHTRQG